MYVEDAKSSSAREASPVESATMRLAGRMDSMHAQVSRLEHALANVLVPVPPTSPPPAIPGAELPRRPPSPLQNELEGIGAQADSLERRIDVLIDRLTV